MNLHISRRRRSAIILGRLFIAPANNVELGKPERPGVLKGFGRQCLRVGTSALS